MKFSGVVAVLCLVPSGLVLYIGITSCTFPPWTEMSKKNDYEVYYPRSPDIRSRNVETDPLLQPLDNEVFNIQSTVMSREARLDLKAGIFSTPGVTAFFDVSVTHVNS